MRPRAIVYFERIYLASLALVPLQQVIGFFFVRNMLADFAGATGAPAGASQAFGAVMIFAALFGLVLALGVPLLFWWLAARKRQEFAKWVLLVISVLAGLNWLLTAAMQFFVPTELMVVPGVGSFQTTQLVLLAIDAAAEILGVIALTYLFRREAVAWFRSLGPAVNADVFR